MIKTWESYDLLKFAVSCIRDQRVSPPWKTSKTWFYKLPAANFSQKNNLLNKKNSEKIQKFGEKNSKNFQNVKIVWTKFQMFKNSIENLKNCVTLHKSSKWDRNIPKDTMNRSFNDQKS